MGLPKLSLAALVLFIGARQPAAAAHTEQQPQQASIIRSEEGVQGSGKTLNTYYFDATMPEIKLSSAASPRPERTALTIKLASSSSVGRFMPVVTPRASGMTHSVSNTWQALQNLASMFASLEPINSQASPNSPHLFPRAAMAVSAASDSAPTHLDIASAIALAEASGRRSSWAEVTPSSVLLLPYGGSAAAVADLMDVTYDAQSDSVTLQVDVVHHPDTVSEFTPHAPQTLAVDAAHYHFDTAPGVRVDAKALLDSLAGVGVGMEGVHMFIKGSSEIISYPRFLDCARVTLTGPTQVPAGQTGTVTVTVNNVFDNECLCSNFGCCNPQGLCTQGCFGDPDAWCCASDVCCGSRCFPASSAIPPSAPTPAAAAAPSPAQAEPKPATKQGDSSNIAAPPPARVSVPVRALSAIRQYPFTTFPAELPVRLIITGDAEWVIEVTPVKTTTGGGGQQSSSGKKKAARRQNGNTTVFTVFTDAEGNASATFLTKEPLETITIIATMLGSRDLQTPATLSVNNAPVPVSNTAHLKLIPSKTYRRCHDPVTLSALATDASGAPVAGAKVAFSAFGDCHPDTDKAIKTTNANGIATITLNSHVPGVESVVAAGVDASGAPVLSDAAHVHFYVERHHAEDREREYYDNGDDERYAKAAAQAAQELVQQAA